MGSLYLINMAIAQVTNNPVMADGPSLHQDAKQQLHQYLRTIWSRIIDFGNGAGKDVVLFVLSQEETGLPVFEIYGNGNSGGKVISNTPLELKEKDETLDFYFCSWMFGCCFSRYSLVRLSLFCRFRVVLVH